MNNNDAHYLRRWNQSSDCCTWIGVSCDGERHVTGLDRNDNLFGEFHNATSLLSLQNLKSLNLAHQDLTSMIPSRPNKLKKLTFLNLSNASFGMQTLTEVSQLTRLVTLDISCSYLIGDEGELENLNLLKLLQNYSFIRQLYLDGVNISANGHEWANVLLALPVLQELGMQGCNLSGPIDSSLARLKNLRVVCLSGNNLSSPVPEFFANFTNLNTLHLIDCGLSGVFPQNIFKVLTLTSIGISYSFGLHASFLDFQMNGSLQMLVLDLESHSFQCFESVSKLFEGPGRAPAKYFSTFGFDLHSNHLRRPLPFLPERLSYLDYSSKNISTPIPSNIGNYDLFFLSFSSNKIHGSIPESICNLTNLELLDLSNNSLTGSIPKCLLAMDGSLEVINLSRNKLIRSLDTFPGSCDLRTLQLKGNLLQVKLPKYLATCDSLEVFDIGNIQIDGRGTKASWSELQIIDLGSNGFGGKIPSEFFKTWKLMLANENDEKLWKLNQLQLDNRLQVKFLTK
ncbi:hypothetical protein L6164_037452 [Bauhinia variegata]|uniref:Uncharacterized protein n=1 Tax=Bauhinia variegata TaxID=167791 RepID=A0ACB9KKV3_BAUVA|nr:hypothetical protein L6164_037452 [Bauhinia variegata]